MLKCEISFTAVQAAVYHLTVDHRTVGDSFGHCSVFKLLLLQPGG